MAITSEQVKELRDRTQAGFLECRNALAETGGDVSRAVEILRERGLAKAEKKASRPVGEGRVESYVHTTNKMAVLVELNCETDFVARNDAFIQLARDIALHIAAMNPQFLRREDVSEEALQADETTNTPQEFYEKYVLLEQPFVRDESVTIGQKIQETIAKTGENIVLRRFVRYEVGA